MPAGFDLLYCLLRNEFVVYSVKNKVLFCQELKNDDISQAYLSQANAMEGIMSLMSPIRDPKTDSS